MEFLPVQRTLRVDGRPARLGGRAFDLLLALVRHADRVVTHDELYDALWPGLAVVPNNLQVHICALRRLLGPAAIATVARRGYRLMLEVEADAGEPQARNDPACNALRDRLRLHSVVTLVGADATARRHTAHAVAQSFGPTRPRWLLEPAMARSSGPAMARLLESIGVDGGLVVLHDAHRVAGLAALAAGLLQAHAGTRLLMSAPAALHLRGESVWTLPPAPPPPAAGPVLRWLQRAG